MCDLGFGGLRDMPLKLRHVAANFGSWIEDGRTRPAKIASAIQSADRFMRMSNGETYQRCPPIVIGRAGAACTDSNEIRPSAAGIVSFQNAQVCEDGVIVTESGTVVADSLAQRTSKDRNATVRRDAHGVYWVSPAPRRTIRKSDAHPYVLMNSAGARYDRWLLEWLPRLTLVAEYVDLRTCRFLLDDDATALHRDTLAAFGIGPEQIETMPSERIIIAHLLYPLPMTVSPWINSPRVVATLEAIGTRMESRRRGPTRLHVADRGAGAQRMVNGATLATIAARHGFETVDTDGLTFAEQVDLFRRAELVVGACGPALANLVFAPRGVSLFALSAEGVTHALHDLASLKGGRYMTLHGYAAAADEPFAVDPDVFDILLERFVDGEDGHP